MSKKARNIYGSTTTSAKCICTPTISPLEQLSTLIELINTLEQLVRESFDPSVATFIISATFSAPSYIPVSVYVRLIWKQEHPGIMFDKNDPIRRFEIKAIYLSLNREAGWKKDPLYNSGLNLS